MEEKEMEENGGNEQERERKEKEKRKETMNNEKRSNKINVINNERMKCK